MFRRSSGALSAAANAYAEQQFDTLKLKKALK
jgi:hypothetical protein